MKQDNITPKPGLKLRKVGGKYMIVDSCGGSVDTAAVYTLNDAAALTWEALCDGTARTPDELVAHLCQVYEVDRECVSHDVQCQLEEWEQMGLVSRCP